MIDIETTRLIIIISSYQGSVVYEECTFVRILLSQIAMMMTMTLFSLSSRSLYELFLILTLSFILFSRL